MWRTRFDQLSNLYTAMTPEARLKTLKILFIGQHRSVLDKYPDGKIRVVKDNGYCLMGTCDFDIERINVVIDNDHITEIGLG